MNVDELRQAFTLSQTITERMRSFRFARVNIILSDESPFPMKPGALLVFHGIPLSTFVDPPDLDLSDYSVTQHFPPFGSGGHNWQHTLDGLATHTPLQADGVRAYTLAFRNGVVEGVAHLPIDGGGDVPRSINLKRVESYVMEGWKAVSATSKKYDIEAPFYIFVSVLNVRGIVPSIPQRWFLMTEGAPCRQDRLLLPEMEIGIGRTDAPSTVLFRPIFDRIANAFGLHGSLSYDQSGKYV
jgi:hypothetical protein